MLARYKEILVVNRERGAGIINRLGLRRPGLRHRRRCGTADFHACNQQQACENRAQQKPQQLFHGILRIVWAGRGGISGLSGERARGTDLRGIMPGSPSAETAPYPPSEECANTQLPQSVWFRATTQQLADRTKTTPSPPRNRQCCGVP